MTQTMDLYRMGLMPLNEGELIETEGGLWWLIVAGVATLVSSCNNDTPSGQYLPYVWGQMIVSGVSSGGMTTGVVR